MVAAHNPAFFLLCMAISTSWALPQQGFPHNSPSSPFGTSQPVQYPIIPYSYGYEVQDPLTNNYQNKAEIKTANGDVFGSYSVLMPDGYIYTTTYNSTKATGFVSKLVKTLAILPQQLASAQSRSGQVQPQQPAAAATAVTPKPQQFQLVKSQPQVPQQQLQQAQQQQQTAQQAVFRTQLPQPQQLQPQQQQQQLSQPLQLQQLQQLQLSQPQQVQSQQLSPQFLQTQQPLVLPTELHGPFRIAL